MPGRLCRVFIRIVKCRAVGDFPLSFRGEDAETWREAPGRSWRGARDALSPLPLIQLRLSPFGLRLRILLPRGDKG